MFPQPITYCQRKITGNMKLQGSSLRVGNLGKTLLTPVCHKLRICGFDKNHSETPVARSDKDFCHHRAQKLFRGIHWQEQHQNSGELMQQ